MDIEKLAGNILGTKLPPVTPTVEDTIAGSILACELQDGSVIVFVSEYGFMEEHEYFLSWEHYQVQYTIARSEMDNMTDRVLGMQIIESNPQVVAVYMGVVL